MIHAMINAGALFVALMISSITIEDRCCSYFKSNDSEDEKTSLVLAICSCFAWSLFYYLTH